MDGWVGQLRCVCGITPRKEFFDPIKFVVSNASENVGVPCLRIDAFELGGLNQGVCDGGGSANLPRASEQTAFTAKFNGPDASLCRFVFDLQEAAVEKGPQLLDPGERCLNELSPLLVPLRRQRLQQAGERNFQPLPPFQARLADVGGE